jgi:ABC-type multidrug transport system permease subunit
MLLVLLAKDLRRAWRNPLPWLINLIVPLAMTALIGLVFGGNSGGGGLGKIRFAVVNENMGRPSEFLRRAVKSMAGQNESSVQFEPVFTNRAAALQLINANKISAVFIIPTNFLSNYLKGETNLSLELIKKPAESIHPAVLEEMAATLVTALNVVSRNFNSEFPEWRKVFEGDGDYQKVSALIQSTGDKLKSAGKYLNPPLVIYEKETAGTNATKAATSEKPAGSKSSSDNIFAFLLLGMTAMFLLFLANNGMSDLLRELRKRTFERYQTMHQQLWPFIASKIIFTVVMLLICSLVMLGGGSLIFGFHWEHLFPLILLAFGYACFVSALFATVVALMPDERRAAVLSNLTGMFLGILGGCAFPPQQLPAFVRDHVTPLLPSYWFAEAARNLECGSGTAPWLFVAIKLLVAGIFFAALAAMLFRKKFKTGVRA